MSEHPVRLAVVGAGLIGRRHLEAILRTEGAETVCLVDPNPDTGGLAADLGVSRLASLEDLLAAEPPDGVILATPNQLHVEQGLLCVRAGLPLLIEKPIADKADEAEGLVEEAEKARIPLLVGHHRRHNPLIAAAKARIDRGDLGKIVAAQTACWLYKPDDYFKVAWRTQKGAGPVLINLIHDIDLLRYFIGEVTEVQAFDSNRTRGHAVEDTAAILLRFESGAIATVTVSDTIVAPWSWELTAAENPAYPETGQSCTFIGGTKGSLEIPSGRFWYQEGERSWWRPMLNATDSVAPEDPLDRQIAHFRDVIRGRAEPLVSGREGLRSLEVVEAVLQAFQAGGSVRLEGR